MGRLVGNLLEFTRLEGGAVRVRSVPMSVEDLVGSARVALRDRLVDHPVQMDVPADCPPVLVDEVLIQSVLINLLDNAVKYSPPGSPITISSQADSQAVTVTVSDRGPGLMPDEVVRVFDKFFRGHSQAGVGGAGLGLAIVKGVVEAHGGSVLARNRVGGGAEFAFTLPRRTLDGDG
jgi:two-component system sensor histidine kinase KdpD